MSRYVECETFSYCGETCPAVDDAFERATDELRAFLSEDDLHDAELVLDKLCKQVKQVGTEKLRDALREAVADKQGAESERDDFERQVGSLESRLSEAEDEIAGLRSQLNEAIA